MKLPMMRLMFLTLATAFASTAHAAVYTWNGASAVDNNFTTTANWVSGSAWTATGAHDVFINSSANWTTINNNNGGNTGMHSLTFGIGLPSLTLTGSQIAINQGASPNSIVNNSGNLQTITAVMYENVHAITINGGAGGLNFTNNFLTNTANAITIQGTVTWEKGIATGGATWAPISVGSGASFTFGSTGYAGQSISNVLSGSGALKFQGGSGTLTAFSLGTNNNTGYTGAMSIDSARVSAGSVNGLTNASSITVNANGQLYLFTSGTFSRPLTLNGSGWADNLGTLRLDSGANYGGAITLTAASKIHSHFTSGTVSGTIDNGGNTLTLSTTNTGALTVSNVISGAGGLNVSAAGGGITLSAANTFSGDTALTAGTLTISNALALQNSTLTPGGAGIVFNRPAGANYTFGGLSGSGNIALVTNSNGGGALGVHLTVGNNDSNTTYAGALSGGGFALLTKTGDGTLTLTGANSYTGATTISQGTLQVGGGGTTGSLSASSAISNNAALVFNRSNTVTQGTDFGAISGSGTLTKLGGGVLILSSANTYNGATTVNAGILRAGASTTVFGNNSAMTLANTSGVALDLNNFNVAIGSLAGGGASGGNVTLGSGTLTTGGDHSSTTFAGVISGTGGFIKTGSGVQTLTGANSYSGATTVSQGTLLINGSLTGAGAAVTVASGATLGGSGMISRAVAINAGGTLSPGNSPDQIFTGALTLAPLSNYDIEIFGPTVGNGVTGYDQTVVTGAVSLNGALLNVLFATGITVGNTFTIIDNDSADAVIGTFAGLDEGDEFFKDGYTFAISYAGGVNSNDVVLTVTAMIPEPSSLLLCGLALLAGGWFKWKKRIGVART